MTIRASQNMSHSTWTIRWGLFFLYMCIRGTDTWNMGRHRSLWWKISAASDC